MKISLTKDSSTRVAADIVALGVRAKSIEDDEQVQRLDKAMQGALSRHVADEGFTGQRGEVLKVPSRGRVSAQWIVLVGLGEGAPAPPDGQMVGARAAGAAKQQRAVAVIPPAEDPATVRATAVGVELGAYRYTEYLTGSRKPKGGVRNAALIVSDAEDLLLKRSADQGRALAESVNLARDLVNAPPNDMNPPALAEVAKAQAERYGVSCKVWNKKQIEKEGMHLLLAVNRGSDVEPRFVHMSYKPTGVSGRVPSVCLVGKGITFDSGGLCIKPPKSMGDMKCDMAGAAVTIATVIAAARLQLPIEVHGLVGATENMPGGLAYRPGDVFPSLDGKTVEIINTDAEGRLVLADALAYACKRIKPTYLVDHATLTGASIVALGPWRAGLFANDEELGRRYEEAAAEHGEAFWRMPLDDDLREMLKSDVADLKHTGEAFGGAVTAALFLREFVGKTKWVHLDIAGPAFQDRPHGIHPKGGTGFGVLTAARFLEGLCEG
ncbi:MAG: leucyl aminopeptidase [Myxococcota bacterium]